jgi:hypothetical protein
MVGMGTGRVVACALVLGALVASCKKADEGGALACEPTVVTVEEVGVNGVADLVFSCEGEGEPLDARVQFPGEALLHVIAEQGGAVRATGTRPARVAPARGGAFEDGEVSFSLDPLTHSIEGAVRQPGPRLPGAHLTGPFRGGYRLVCRVPSAVLNVQQRGVAAPGSEGYVDDVAFASDFCSRFAPLR